MRCEQCGEREATVHLTQLLNGEMNKLHLCQDCAGKNGINVEDPAADLAVSVAVASAFLDKPLIENTVLLGEVGLTGEIRSIAQPLVRINEAQKLGFKRCIIARNSLRGLKSDASMQLIGVARLQEALDAAFGRK